MREKALTDEEVKALVSYRLQRAKETLAEVEYLKGQGFYNTAVNRLYYACYYAAVALMVKNHLHPATHAGVRQMLGMYFVVTGKISKETGRCFSMLFERRTSSDYDDFAYSTLEEVNELQPKAAMFINEVEHLLSQE